MTDYEKTIESYKADYNEQIGNKIRELRGTYFSPFLKMEIPHDIVLKALRDPNFDEFVKDSFFHFSQRIAEAPSVNTRVNYPHRNGAIDMIYDARINRAYVNWEGSACMFDRITPVSIKRRDRATIVEWVDGTQTKIRLQEGEADAGTYAAFCMALAKKLYPSHARLERIIESADEEVFQRKAAEAQERAKKEHEERMRVQLRKANKRIARMARRAFKRKLLSEMAVQSIEIEEEEHHE